MTHIPFLPRYARGGTRHALLPAASVAPVAQSVRSSSPTIRSRANPKRQDASKIAGVGHRSVSADLTRTCSASPAIRLPTSARRTSTPSTRCPTRAGSPTASVRTPCRSRKLARGPLTTAGRRRARGRSRGRSTAGIGARLHDARRAGHVVLSFDANGYPEAATGAILVADELFWALGYWQAESYLDDRASRAARDRRHGVTLPSPSAHATDDAPRRLDDVLARAAPERRRLVSRRGAALALPGKPSSAASATSARGPTIPTTSCRTSIAASCAR